MIRTNKPEPATLRGGIMVAGLGVLSALVELL